MVFREVVQSVAGLLPNLVIDARAVEIFSDDVRARLVLSNIVTIVGEVCRNSRRGRALHATTKSIVFVSDAPARRRHNLCQTILEVLPQGKLTTQKARGPQCFLTRA